MINIKSVKTTSAFETLEDRVNNERDFLEQQNNEEVISNDFENEYSKIREIATSLCNEKDGDIRKEILEKYDAFRAKIREKGEEYEGVFALYESMKDRNNDYVDIDCHRNESAIEYINLFRKFGITHFTFSSTWSSAIELAWVFIQNNCGLKGMVEINSKFKNPSSRKYDKIHALLFEIK
jgi:hypothetical protein